MVVCRECVQHLCKDCFRAAQTFKRLHVVLLLPYNILLSTYLLPPEFPSHSTSCCIRLFFVSFPVIVRPLTLKHTNMDEQTGTGVSFISFPLHTHTHFLTFLHPSYFFSCTHTANRHSSLPLLFNTGLQQADLQPRSPW